MGAAIGRTVVMVTLALLVPLTAGAAALRSPDLDMCSAQKQKDCRRVSLAELDRLRGGMVLMTSIGPIEVTFGLTQAVYINNKLVAVTQLIVMPAVNTPQASISQIQAASAALQSALAAPQSSPAVTGTGAIAGSTPGASKGATSAAPVVAASPSPGAGQTAGLNGTLNAVPNSAGALGQTSSGSSSQAAATSSSVAPSGAVSPTVSVNGSVVTPSNPIVNVPKADVVRVVIVQNGAGNVVVPSAADIASGVGTIIQNTANNQTIHALTEMNVSIALSKLMNAASISNAVKQGMITSRP